MEWQAQAFRRMQQNIEIKTNGDILAGEPDDEDGEPTKEIAFASKSITFKIGEDGSEINLTEEAKICASNTMQEVPDWSE